MRALFPLALAIVALFSMPAQANDIVPVVGEYHGSREIHSTPYEVFFKLDGIHVQKVRLVINKHLVHLDIVTQRSAHSFEAHNGSYEVDGHWLHNRSVHCEIIHLVKPKTRIGSLEAHHQ